MPTTLLLSITIDLMGVAEDTAGASHAESEQVLPVIS